MAPRRPAPARGRLRRRPRRRSCCTQSAGCRPRGGRPSSASSRRHALHRRRARAGHPPGGRAPSHAGRFCNAALATVHDLGCGIGSDAVAMSALGVHGQGVDVDPVTAAVADVNLRPWPDSRARVGLAEDVRGARATRCARGWACGSTRPAGHPGATDATAGSQRVFRLDEISPSWEHVLQVATARAGHRGQAVARRCRTTPVPLGAEAQWTSYAGEVLECAVWWGPLAQRPGRSALVLGPSRRRSRSTRRWPSRRADRRVGSAPSGRGSTSPTAR